MSPYFYPTKIDLPFICLQKTKKKSLYDKSVKEGDTCRAGQNVSFHFPFLRDQFFHKDMILNPTIKEMEGFTISQKSIKSLF